VTVLTVHAKAHALAPPPQSTGVVPPKLGAAECCLEALKALEDPATRQIFVEWGPLFPYVWPAVRGTDRGKQMVAGVLEDGAMDPYKEVLEAVADLAMTGEVDVLGPDMIGTVEGFVHFWKPMRAAPAWLRAVVCSFEQSLAQRCGQGASPPDPGGPDGAAGAPADAAPTDPTAGAPVPAVAPAHVAPKGKAPPEARPAEGGTAGGGLSKRQKRSVRDVRAHNCQMSAAAKADKALREAERAERADAEGRVERADAEGRAAAIEASRTKQGLSVCSVEPMTLETARAAAEVAWEKAVAAGLSLAESFAQRLDVAERTRRRQAAGQARALAERCEGAVQQATDVTPTSAAAEARRADVQRGRWTRARKGVAPVIPNSRGDAKASAAVPVPTAVDPTAQRERAIAAAEARGRDEDEARDAAMAAANPHLANHLRLDRLEGMTRGPSPHEQRRGQAAALKTTYEDAEGEAMEARMDAVGALSAAERNVELMIMAILGGDRPPSPKGQPVAATSAQTEDERRAELEAEMRRVEAATQEGMRNDLSYLRALKMLKDNPDPSEEDLLAVYRVAPDECGRSLFVAQLMYVGERIVAGSGADPPVVMMGTDSDAGGEPSAPVLATAPGDVEFKSVAQAKKLHNWATPGGFRDAVVAEIKRVTEYYGAAKLVSVRRLHEARRQYGKNKVIVQHSSMPGKWKRNAAGEVTRAKARWVIADLKCRFRLENTFAATLAPATHRLLVQLGVMLPGATFGTLDCAGAYFNGTPIPPEEEGGRALFTEVPAGWEEFGFAQFDERGDKQYFEVVGNMPGRQDAGRVWAKAYSEKLEQWGFKASIVDTRLFYKADSEGKLMLVGVFVDDNFMISQSPGLTAEFQANWRESYDEAPDMAATMLDFCGVGMEQMADGSVTLHVDKAIDNLAEKLAGLGEEHQSWARKLKADVPMVGSGLRDIAEEPSDENPLMPVALLETARSIMGLGGWIVCTLRADAYFAYTALAKRLVTNFTSNVWRAVVRWATYIVETKAIRMTYRKPPAGAQFMFFSDSSALNGPDSTSYGGWCAIYEGSGAFDWASANAARVLDSSGSCELNVATGAVKSAMGARMLFGELGLDQAGPTDIYLDARAALDGAGSEKVSKAMKFMAARYAMLRQAAEAGQVSLQKIDTTLNVADLFTKPLVGETFVRLRGRVMGEANWKVHVL